jgi:hypothetical protein
MFDEFDENTKIIDLSKNLTKPDLKNIGDDGCKELKDSLKNNKNIEEIWFHGKNYKL